MYRGGEMEERRAPRSSFKKSENKVEHRMSLFEWGSQKLEEGRRAMVYRSRNEFNSLSDSNDPRQSAEYIRSSNQSRNRWARNCHLSTVYGIRVKQREARTYTSTKHEQRPKERDTGGIVDSLVKN
jgi:hypothetical protein